jgi:hypothetical protein
VLVLGLLSAVRVQPLTVLIFRSLDVLHDSMRPPPLRICVLLSHRWPSHSALTSLRASDPYLFRSDRDFSVQLQNLTLRFAFVGIDIRNVNRQGKGKSTERAHKALPNPSGNHMLLILGLSLGQDTNMITRVWQHIVGLGYSFTYIYIYIYYVHIYEYLGPNFKVVLRSPRDLDSPSLGVWWGVLGSVLKFWEVDVDRFVYQRANATDEQKTHQ